MSVIVIGVIILLVGGIVWYLLSTSSSYNELDQCNSDMTEEGIDWQKKVDKK